MRLTDGYHDVPNGKIALVVTHLELRAPHLRGVPCPKDLIFAELPRDLALYRRLFRQVGETWLWTDRLKMDDAALSRILEDPQMQFYTLEKSGAPRAILELDFSAPDACKLAYFGLAPDLIGTGAGAYLMDRAQELAFAQDGVTRFHLHTCTLDSPQALGFYRRSGFQPTHRQIEIADDPRLLGYHAMESMPELPVIEA